MLQQTICEWFARVPLDVVVFAIKLKILIHVLKLYLVQYLAVLSEKVTIPLGRRDILFGNQFLGLLIIVLVCRSLGTAVFTSRSRTVGIII